MSWQSLEINCVATWRGPCVLVVQKPLHQALENTQNETCPRRTWSLVPKLSQICETYMAMEEGALRLLFKNMKTTAQNSQIHLFMDSDQHISTLTSSSDQLLKLRTFGQPTNPSHQAQLFIHEKIHLKITEVAVQHNAVPFVIDLHRPQIHDDLSNQRQGVRWAGGTIETKHQLRVFSIEAAICSPSFLA